MIACTSYGQRSDLLMSLQTNFTLFFAPVSFEWPTTIRNHGFDINFLCLGSNLTSGGQMRLPKSLNTICRLITWGYYMYDMFSF